MPTFDDCPVEIIELIAGTLPYSDVRKLRLVNKRAALGIFRQFAKIGFSRVGFMITAESIQLLENISQHEGLARYVEDVFLNSVNLTVYRDPCADIDYRVRYKLGKPKPICLELRECEEYHRVVASNKLLVGTDDLRGRLCVILPRFRNLKKLGAHSNTSDPDLRGWRSRSFFKWLELDRSKATRMALHSELFWILSSVMTALDLKMRHLYIDNVHLQHITPPQTHSLRNVRATLHRFDCQVAACCTARGRHLAYNVDKIKATCGTMHDTLRAMPNLYDFGLVIYEPIQMLGSITDYSLTTSYNLIRHLGTHQSVQDLRHLRLEASYVSSELLTLLLRSSSSSLVSLSIRHTACMRSSWSPFFRFLLDECPTLEHIYFYDLRIATGTLHVGKSEPAHHTRHRHVYKPARASIKLEAQGTQAVRCELTRLEQSCAVIAGFSTSAPRCIQKWITDGDGMASGAWYL